MRFWVTRTEPGATRLAAAVEAAGHDTWVRPVLRIEPLPNQTPAGAFDVTIFLSEHAVHHALGGGWSETPALAIGPGTQAALAQYGVTAAIPDHASSEGIADFLAHDPPATVLVAAGAGGRDALPELLGALGTAVVSWHLYQRSEVRDPLPADTRIDAIIAGSGGGLRVARDLWFASGRSAEVPVVVPSERVAEAARGMGLTNVHVSAGAGVRATVATVRHMANERHRP